MKRMSKSLLCGVIATSFFIINCQKAPNRPVKADGSPAPQGNTASNASMMKCTDDILKMIKSQSEIMKAMDALSAQTPVTDQIKTDLTAKATELDKVSSDLKSAIQALKVGGQAGIGCNEVPMVDGKEGAPVPHTLAQLDEAREGVVARASGVTRTTLPGAPAPKIVADTTILISENLAAALTDDKNVSKDGKIGDHFIQDGDLKASGADGVDYKKVEADTSKTSCLITLGNKDPGVDAGAEAKVATVSMAQMNTVSKRSQIVISLQVKDDAVTTGNYMLGLTCNIADGQDAATEARKALGTLISEKPVEQPAADPKSGDATTPPPAANPGSGDATTPPPAANPGSGDATTPPPAADPGSGDATTPPPAANPGSGDATTPPPAASASSGDTTTAAGRLAAQRTQAAQQAMTILSRTSGQ